MLAVGIAARRLGLTPASVSRTLGLLEDALGEEWFNRVGRRLVINPAGVALHCAAMRCARRSATSRSVSAASRTVRW